MTRTTSSLVLALALALAAGCGGSGSALCDQACDCTGECSDNDREECYDELDDAEHEADSAECSGEYDEYISCLNSEFECRDGRVDADGCGPEKEDFNDCYRGRGNGGDGIDL